MDKKVAHLLRIWYDTPCHFGRRAVVWRKLSIIDCLSKKEIKKSSWQKHEL